MHKPSSPPPQFAGDYQSQRAHLLWMASMPGAREHASYRAKELDADSSGMWTGIYADVKAELKRLKNPALAAGPVKA